EMLGHTSVTITLATYSHVLPMIQREVSQPIEELTFVAGCPCLCTIKCDGALICSQCLVAASKSTEGDAQAIPRQRTVRIKLQGMFEDGQRFFVASQVVKDIALTEPGEEVGWVKFNGTIIGGQGLVIAL